MAIVDELVAVLGYDVRGEQNAKRYEQRLKSINGQMDKFAKAAGLAAAIAVTAAGTAFAMLGRNVVNTSAQFEAFETTLVTIEGSADKARAAMTWIAEFGKTTPYEVAQVTDAFVKLKAYGIDPIANDALRTLGDTASAMGKPLNQSVEAFADAATGEFERLKEFGLKAKQKGEEVTFAWSQNGKELTKTVKKNATDIKAFVLENFGSRFSGAMDRQSKTWNGMMSNLADNWTDFKKRVGDKGFFGLVSGMLRGVLDRIKELDADGSLDRWAQNLSDVFSYAANAMAAFAAQMARHAQLIADNWDSLSGPLAVVGLLLARLLLVAAPLTFGLLALAFAVDDFLTYLEGGESVIGKFIEWIKNLTGASDGVATAIAAIGVAVAAGLLAAFIKAPVAAIAALSGGLVQGLAVLAPRLLPLLAALFTPAGLAVAVAAAAVALVAYFWDDLVAAFNGLDLTKIGTDLMNGLWEGMKAIGSGIRDWITGLFDFSGAKVTPPSTGAYGADLNRNPTSSGALTDDQRARMLQNLRGNLGRTGSADAAKVGGDRTDNRNQSVTTSVTVNQTVTQATQAPGEAARATGQAVGKSATAQRTQIETEPAL